MSNTTTPSVVAIGELLWDMLPDGRKPGGAPANFIYHVAQNGVRGTAVTAVGDDELGRDLVSILADNDVNVAAQVNDYPTGITAVRLDDGGIPEYDVVKGVAWDHIEFTDEVRGLVRGADAICYGTIAAREAWGTRDTIYRMIDAASPDAIRLFDINIRSGFVNKEVITRFLEGATILKINDEELPIVANLFGLDSPGDDIASRQRVMEALAGMFDLDVTILTAGDAYSIVMGRDETSILPTPKVDVVDTVGAGDSFSGAFLAYLLRGFSIPTAHQRAVEVSAFVCGRSGALAAIPCGAAGTVIPQSLILRFRPWRAFSHRPGPPPPISSSTKKDPSCHNAISFPVLLPAPRSADCSTVTTPPSSMAPPRSSRNIFTPATPCLASPSVRR